MDLSDLILKLVMIGIFLGVAFPVHEFAHAWVAYCAATRPPSCSGA